MFNSPLWIGNGSEHRDATELDCGTFRIDEVGAEIERSLGIVD